MRWGLRCGSCRSICASFRPGRTACDYYYMEEIGRKDVRVVEEGTEGRIYECGKGGSTGEGFYRRLC